MREFYRVRFSSHPIPIMILPTKVYDIRMFNQLTDEDGEWMLFLWAVDIGRAFGRIERKGSGVRPETPSKKFRIRKGITNTVMFDSEFDPHPAIEQAWLVSGNEGFQKKLMMGNDSLRLDEF